MGLALVRLVLRAERRAVMIPRADVPGIITINEEHWRLKRMRKPWTCALSGRKIKRGDLAYSNGDSKYSKRILPGALATAERTKKKRKRKGVTR